MQPSDPEGFQPIKKRRLSDEVTAQIRARIAAGDLRPGDKLPAEREMADSFAVSRGAVREAMRNLELAGIVNLRHGVKGGAFIGHGDPALMGDNIRDLFHLGGVSLSQLTEARIWIESTVVRVACDRASEDDLAELAENVAQAEALYRQERFEEKIDINIEFHNILARATHNPILAMLMSALMEVMGDFARSVGPEPHDLTLKARRRFLGAMAKRDPDQAVAIMVSHLEQLQKRYETVVRDRQQSSAGK